MKHFSKTVATSMPGIGKMDSSVDSIRGGMSSTGVLVTSHHFWVKLPLDQRGGDGIERVAHRLFERDELDTGSPHALADAVHRRAGEGDTVNESHVGDVASHRGACGVCLTLQLRHPLVDEEPLDLGDHARVLLRQRAKVRKHE